MYQSVSLNAVGVSEWVPLNYRQRPPEVSLDVIVASTVTGSYNVEYTYDDLMGEGNDFMNISLVVPTSITRAAAVATVVSPAHGLNVGDSIRVINTGFPNGTLGAGATSMDGLFTVASVVDFNTFTYAVANSGITTASTWAKYIPMHVFSLTAFAAKTATQDGSLTQPVRAVRLHVLTYAGTGNVTLQVTQGQN